MPRPRTRFFTDDGRALIAVVVALAIALGLATLLHWG